MDREEQNECANKKKASTMYDDNKDANVWSQQ